MDKHTDKNTDKTTHGAMGKHDPTRKQTIKTWLLEGSTAGEPCRVYAWVKNRRVGKEVFFLMVSDGSCVDSLQVVGQVEAFSGVLEEVHVGACVALVGDLVASAGASQRYELALQSLRVLGQADPELYPLQPKRHSLEFLREIGHLRSRTTLFGAVFRIRHHMSYAIHDFFHQAGFYHVHTPILTASDAEGAGAMFRVVADKENFFGREARLTVSGQLEAELMAMGLSRVYTFGPTFRAEDSNTPRHLAEFWMVEPEMAFYDLEECYATGLSLLRYVMRYVMEACGEDLAFLEKWGAGRPGAAEKGSLRERLSRACEGDVSILSYTEAIAILEDSRAHKKGRFAYPVAWGKDLQTEHEHYLLRHCGGPVVVRDYPKEIKAFYMRENADERTVAAMDILFPQVGELIGGSQREERLGHVQARMKAMGVPEKDLWWYLDTRRFGTAPHSGFGLGFERFVQFVTGMENIRDVILFPRYPGHIAF